MVVAYLRGLLRRSHNFGDRSRVSEEIMLESLAGDAMAESIESSVALDAALLPLLTEKGVRETVRKSSARLGRAAELRLFDIYRVAQQLAGTIKIENQGNELSLFQVYQIAEKQGIFDAFDQHNSKEKYRPLL